MERRLILLFQKTLFLVESAVKLVCNYYISKRCCHISVSVAHKDIGAEGLKPDFQIGQI